MESPIVGWLVWLVSGGGGAAGFVGGFLLVRAVPRVSPPAVLLTLLMFGTFALLVFASEVSGVALLLAIAPNIVGAFLGRLTRPWPPDWSQVRPRAARLRWPPDRR
ncbi:hypothetical protein V3W47_17830 [Deinococcus sp. YIM 134068]|uniref:hypothetical protein n=1 Tax=Deinococcus lichenicola TaxID=3118910 RepID=UPI002F948E64